MPDSSQLGFDFDVPLGYSPRPEAPRPKFSRTPVKEPVLPDHPVMYSGPPKDYPRREAVPSIMPEVCQPGLEFDGTPGETESGLVSWRAARAAKVRELSLRSGLPVGHQVEATLTSGPLLRGRLIMVDEPLWIESGRVEQVLFEVDGVPFRIRELDSCIRLD